MKRPNLLIFMTDQQRGDTVTDPRCLTPNLDRLRQKGVTFTGAFCPSPHCCPSRATFMSGLYPSEHGVWNNVNVPNAISRGPNPEVRMWSEELAAAGYELYYSGKWHVSATAGPEEYGWRPVHVTEGKWIVTPEEQWASYEKTADMAESAGERKEGEIIRPGWDGYRHYGTRENPFRDSKVVDAAIESIRSTPSGDKPWCRFIGTTGPHDPYFVPERFLDLYRDIEIELPENFDDDLRDRPHLYQRTRRVFSQLSREEHRRALVHYFALCTYEDELFGRVLEELEAKGELENTVVVYLSDHGDYAGEHGLWCKGLPCFRSAYHVPLVIAGPGIAAPGREVAEFVSLADFAPTFRELAGCAGDSRCSGASLVPFLAGRRPESWRNAVFTQSNGNEQYGIQRSVTARGWKYVYNGFDFDELYDLEEDPHETRNRIDDPACAGKVEELCTELWRFGREHKDNCINSYIMVGFAPYGPRSAFRKPSSAGASPASQF